MDGLATFALTVFTGFFAIMNSIANVPIFLSLTESADKSEKRKIARKPTLTAFLIVLAFVVLGKLIFELFGITIPAFKITGGILIIAIIGADMVIDGIKLAFNLS